MSIHAKTAEAVALRQETVMGHAIPTQQPAVVLRSHFDHLRALLAITLVAVVGLTVAVVILASDSDEVSGTSTAEPIESTRGALPAQLPNTRYEQSTDGVLPARLPNTRYEQSGDSVLPARLPNTHYEQGIDGALPARLPSSSPATEAKDEAATPAIEAKHEAATAAAIGHPGSGTEFRGSKASDYGTSQYRFTNPQTGAVNPQTGTPAQP
jgi:hypothetical protein